jgi:hypothetical protein
VLTDIRALADHFLIALPNINSRLIHKANQTHRWFFVAPYEVRWLELALDAAKVALAAKQAETTAA